MFFATLSALLQTFASPKTIFIKYIVHLSVVQQYFDETLNYLYAPAFMSKNIDNDTFTTKQMLHQDDMGRFILGIKKKNVDHEQRNRWTLLPHSKLPPDAKYHHVNMVD